MFHEHVPRPQRTSRERCAIALRSAFLRLVRACTERQQKCSLPQCVTEHIQSPRGGLIRSYRLAFPAPIIPLQTVVRRNLQRAMRRDQLRHVSAYRKRSLIRGGKKSCSSAWERTGKTGGMDPTSPGLARLLPSRTRARVGPLSGCNPSLDRPGWQTLSTA